MAAATETIRQDILAAVRSARLWHDASEEDVRWLASCAKIVELARGELVFREGDLPDSIAVIVEGHARSVHTEDGRTSVLETHWKSDVLGAISAFSNTPFATDIEAAEPLTLAMIPVGTLKELIATEPAVALSVISEISRRWATNIAVSKRNSSDVMGRLVQYLTGLSRIKLGAESFAIEIPVARVELAATLLTTPETLSRAFRSLQDQGLIESHDRMIIVPDVGALTSRHAEKGPREPAAG